MKTQNTAEAGTAQQTFELFWSPEGKRIAIVKAQNARKAIRKAPMPYRKYLGEIYAVASAH